MEEKVTYVTARRIPVPLPKSAEKVASNGESTNAGTTESSGSGDDALELLVHALLTVTGHNETLVLELLGDIAGSGARDLDPGLGEDGASDEHVDDVDSGLDRVEERLSEVQRRRHSLCSRRYQRQRRAGRSPPGLPDTEELDEEVVGEAAVQHLADQEDVGGQSRLQHDRHVGGVEEADRVRAAHTTLAGRLDRNLNTETLEVDDGGKDDEGGQIGS